MDDDSLRRGNTIVRDARKEELDEVAELLTECYADYAKEFRAELWATYRDEIPAVASRLSVAQLIIVIRDASIAGTVTFYPEAALDGHDWPAGIASFRLLAVRPDLRGAGLGRALISECMTRARRHGASRLGLHTAPFMHAATALYERLGFVRAPDLDFDAGHYYGGNSDGATPPVKPVPGLAYVRKV